MSVITKLRKNNPSKKQPRGKLIVLDGIDGSGKATQTKLLVETLKLSDYKVEVFDFPQYGTKSAGPLEEYLNGKYGQLNPYGASLFYAVDRLDASFPLKKALEEGKIVICNRYVSSNAAHQGGKISDQIERLHFFKWLDNLEYNIFGIPKPDLNIILHLPPKMAQKLVDRKSTATRKYVNGKKRDIHEADLVHLKNAETVYLQIAKLFPSTKLVECLDKGKLLGPEQIHNKVWELVRRIALKNTLPPLK